MSEGEEIKSSIENYTSYLSDPQQTVYNNSFDIGRLSAYTDDFSHKYTLRRAPTGPAYTVINKIIETKGIKLTPQFLVVVSKYTDPKTTTKAFAIFSKSNDLTNNYPLKTGPKPAIPTASKPVPGQTMDLSTYVQLEKASETIGMLVTTEQVEGKKKKMPEDPKEASKKVSDVVEKVKENVVAYKDSTVLNEGVEGAISDEQLAVLKKQQLESAEPAEPAEPGVFGRLVRSATSAFTGTSAPLSDSSKIKGGSGAKGGKTRTETIETAKADVKKVHDASMSLPPMEGEEVKKGEKIGEAKLSEGSAETMGTTPTTPITTTGGPPLSFTTIEEEEAPPAVDGTGAGIPVATDVPPVPREPIPTATNEVVPNPPTAFAAQSAPEAHKVKYHPNAILLYFGSVVKPDWDLELEKNVFSPDYKISTQEIIDNSNTIVQTYGAQLLIYKRMSDTLEEMHELLQLQFCILRNLQRGTRSKQALVPISSLVSFANKMAGNTPVAPAAAPGAGAGTGTDAGAGTVGPGTVPGEAPIGPAPAPAAPGAGTVIDTTEQLKAPPAYAGQVQSSPATLTPVQAFDNIVKAYMERPFDEHGKLRFNEDIIEQTRYHSASGIRGADSLKDPGNQFMQGIRIRTIKKKSGIKM